MSGEHQVFQVPAAIAAVRDGIAAFKIEDLRRQMIKIEHSLRVVPVHRPCAVCDRVREMRFARTSFSFRM